MAFTIALAGNPNCGKTSIFNELTGARQHVGNWPGVTVDKKEGVYKKDKTIHILDLPGTYSLSPYTEEEKIALDYIVNQKPSVVIDILDGTSLERNLYLALQIMEAGVPVVLALNMIDEVNARGDKIDIEKLSQLLGVSIVPTCGRNGQGVTELMEKAIAAGKSGDIPKAHQIYSKGDSEEVIADKRYKYISGIVSQAVVKGAKTSGAGRAETTSDKIDKIVTNRWLAIPIFAIVMYAMFACTFSENWLWLGLPSPGVWLAGIVEVIWGIITGWVSTGLDALDASDWAYGLVVDGIFGGIGGVLGFMPLVLVLYLLMSFLEDSGYMARIAFVMDRVFRRFGLSGRSFIPLLMSFGCSVPAIMATRTLESEKDRKITTILTGFMPCGAKLPIFAMFISILFVGDNRTLISFSIYILSIVVAILVSLFLNLVVYKSTASNFLMELPKYRLPTLKSVGIHGWEKVKGFAMKAGSVILVSTIIIWLLSNFNANSFNGKNLADSNGETNMCEMNDSFMASVGSVVAPIFKPLGFGEWRPTVGVVTGWIAKEMVVVTFAQLYSEDVTDEYLQSFFGVNSPEELEELGFEEGLYDFDTAFGIYSEGTLFEGGDENALPTMQNDIPTKAAAYSYMAFNLLCMPCFAAVGAMKRELKTWKRTGGAVGIQMVTAYIVALIINLVGGLFG